MMDYRRRLKNEASFYDNLGVHSTHYVSLQMCCAPQWLFGVSDTELERSSPQSELNPNPN